MANPFKQKSALLLHNPRRFLELAIKGRLMGRLEDAWLDITRPAQSNPVNKIDIRCLGMRRSGNHAIIEWLIDAVAAAYGPNSSVHLNDIPLGVNGYRSRHQFPAPIDTPEYTHQMGIRRRRHFDPITLLVRSYEDYTAEEFAVKEPQKFYGQSENSYDVVIIRDPFNLFASRIKSGKTETQSGISPIDLYLNHFHAQQSNPNLISIFYNRWLLDQDYRDDVLTTIGLPKGHKVTLTSSPRGGGSSFVGAKKDLDLQELVRRWQKMDGDSYFQKQIVNNSELSRIVKEHFPEVLS